MESRPDFLKIKSFDEFAKYYWYRKELAVICRQLNMDYTGTKQELNEQIKAYFEGKLTEKKRKCTVKKANKEISLECPLLDCGFSFNAKFREFFAKQTDTENFKFSADMAEAWRKVKREQDRNFTVGDLVEVYYHKSNYAKYDNSSCEWNQFLKDFCADEQNSKFQNKMKAAAVLWKKVRESSLPKVYSEDLVLKYQNFLQEKE